MTHSHEALSSIEVLAQGPVPWSFVKAIAPDELEREVRTRVAGPLARIQFRKVRVPVSELKRRAQCDYGLSET